MRVRRNRVPQDDAALSTELVEEAMHDGAGRLAPAAAPTGGLVGWSPAEQVALAGESDARPAHALVAGRLPNGDDVGFSPFFEVIPQVGEPDRSPAWHIVRSAIPPLLEAGPNPPPPTLPD